MTLSLFGSKMEMEGNNRALGLKEFLISASKPSSFQSSLVPIHGQGSSNLIYFAASRSWGDDKEGCDRAQEAGTEPGERNGVGYCGQWGKQELGRHNSKH